MPLDTWITFAIATAILLVIPGPTILTVISYSLSHGKKVCFPLVAAVALGDTVALLLSLIGVGSLLASSVFWFQVVKWVGGLYLIYLGIKLLRNGLNSQAVDLPETKIKGWRLFADTFTVTALNPKGIVFFIAFLPQFVTPGADALQQFSILGSTFVFLGTLNAYLYAQFATAARHWIQSPLTQKIYHCSGGLLLTLAGLWALSSRKPV